MRNIPRVIHRPPEIRELHIPVDPDHDGPQRLCRGGRRAAPAKSQCAGSEQACRQHARMERAGTASIVATVQRVFGRPGDVAPYSAHVPLRARVNSAADAARPLRDLRAGGAINGSTPRAGPSASAAPACTRPGSPTGKRSLSPLATTTTRPAKPCSWRYRATACAR